MTFKEMFGKVMTKKEDVPAGSVPVNDVMELKKKGLNSEQIITELRGKGYTLTQIKDALTQADIKSGVQSPLMPLPSPEIKPETRPHEMPKEMLPMPVQRPLPPPLPPPVKKPEKKPEIKEEISAPEKEIFKREDIETLVESIVEEKWEDFKAILEEINEWREELKQKMEFISQRLDKIEGEVENVAKKSLKKEESYTKTVEDVNIHMEAFQKAMQEVIPSLAASIRELKDVSKTLKK